MPPSFRAFSSWLLFQENLWAGGGRRGGRCSGGGAGGAVGQRRERGVGDASPPPAGCLPLSRCWPSLLRPPPPSSPHQVELVEVSVTSVIHSSQASKSSLHRSSCGEGRGRGVHEAGEGEWCGESVSCLRWRVASWRGLGVQGTMQAQQCASPCAACVCPGNPGNPGSPARPPAPRLEGLRVEPEGGPQDGDGHHPRAPRDAGVALRGGERAGRRGRHYGDATGDSQLARWACAGRVGLPGSRPLPAWRILLPPAHPPWTPPAAAG